MSDACFIAEVAGAVPGDVVEVSGAEGHHAAAVRRIRVGESVLVTDGRGAAVRGPVVEVAKKLVRVEVAETLSSPHRDHRWVAVQALAKGERADLAVETLTEVGVDEVVAWQADRSISRWNAEKRDKGVTRWLSTARQATKQSRRFRIPEGSFATTDEVVRRIAAADRAFVLHEEAEAVPEPCQVPESGEIVLVIGPEGGISPEELDRFVEAGALPVQVCDGVLRTSTAGVVGLAQLKVLAGLR